MSTVLRTQEMHMLALFCSMVMPHTQQSISGSVEGWRGGDTCILMLWWMVWMVLMLLMLLSFSSVSSVILLLRLSAPAVL
jgi:hypothetical protein